MFWRKKKKEVSKGGSEIFRHKDQENKDWRPPSAYCVFAEEISAHFDSLFPNRETSVFHEIISDLVHIDVHIMKPAPDENYYVIYTTGMSDLPMTLPNEINDRKNWEYAELFMFLPDSWNPGDALDVGSDISNNDYWAIQVIKFLARMPHEYKTWLGQGHTIPNGPDYEPYLDGSDMSGVVLLDMGENYGPLNTKNGSKVNFYMVMPITRAETAYKLEYGMSALIDKFEEKDVPMIIDMYRKSVV